MKKFAVLALSLLSLSAIADNERGFYIGLGASSLKDYQDGVEDVSRIKVGEIFGGYKYNAALGAELRLGDGLSTGTSRFFFDDKGKVQIGGSLERELNTYQSFYYKPELVNDEAKLYALLGYTHMSSWAKYTDAAGKVTRKNDSVSGASYGLGVGFVIDEHFNINFEYRNLCDEVSGKPNIATVNVDYRF